MARRKLTVEQQLKGVRTALRSARTPPQLKEGLRKREKELSGRLLAPGTRRRRAQKRSFFGTLFS
jgi:hypothetical protein